jgi:hypothetical protein
MTQRRLITTSLSIALFAGLGAGWAHADDPKPCAATSFELPKVEAACKAGGLTAAKKLMKKATDKAKAAGEDVKCKTCHTDLKTFALTGPDTVASLAKWL